MDALLYTGRCGFRYAVGMNDQFDQHKLAVIFYADIAGYSRLTARDERGTHQRGTLLWRINQGRCAEVIGLV